MKTRQLTVWMVLESLRNPNQKYVSSGGILWDFYLKSKMSDISSEHFVKLLKRASLFDMNRNIKETRKNKKK